MNIESPRFEGLRLTIPAREALEHAGNRVERLERPDGPRFAVTLERPPAGLVLCLIGHGDEQHSGLRLADEPEYPGEWPEGQGIAWHERGAWLPCPSCGAALVWYEAGYVPGYRVCTGDRHHHVMLSTDGRTARPVERKPRHIAYVTGLDGWGDGEPTQEDRESFCALVEARLAAWYPEHTVEAYVEEDALESRVMTDDDAIDEAEVCSRIGADVWNDWCSGERAAD